MNPTENEVAQNIQAYVSQVQAVDENSDKKPVGYVRSKIFNRSVLVRALIDSGNLFADLISEKLAKILNLSIKGKRKNVGTAATSGSVTVLGRTRAFYLYLEGIINPVKVEPYVVRDLAHPLNLGQSWLRRHQADMSFRSDGIQLKIGGKVATLTTSSAPLNRPSIDTRIHQLLTKWKTEGANPHSTTFDSILDLRLHAIEAADQKPPLPGMVVSESKNPVEFDETRYKVYAKDRTMLKAGTHTVVRVEGNKAECNPLMSLPENHVYLQPKRDHNYTNSNLLFVHAGTYTREGHHINVIVSNLGFKDVVLPQKCTLGYASEAVAYAPSINVLDHKPADTLSAEELRERRAYISAALQLDDNPNLADPKDKEAVIQMFLDNFDAVSIGEFDYGLTSAMKFHIEIPKGTPPVRAKARPLNPFQEKDLQAQIKAWEDAKIIEPSLSPWASALVPCKKKGTDKLRWAIDYRQVNRVTVKDSFPLANIDANLHKLAGAKIFSTLDSCGAFHTLPVSEESRDFTTFISCFGSYRFTRLPFGLCNAPSAYSRLVALALSHLPPGFSLGYIDDVIVYSANIKEHLSHLRQILELHCRFGMKLNLKKCHIGRDTVEYLGHQVSAQGIAMIDSYVERILSWPLPKDATELKSFLGFAGYYRSFIKDFSRLTANMNQMKNSKGPLEWSEVDKKNFEALKEAFAGKPLRGYPRYDSDEPFILDSDFSSTNLACVLSQVQDGKERFLGCVAKKCDRAQRNYPSCKGELAAVILGLRKFEHILRAKPFVIRTDSKCVEFLQTMREVRGLYARWLAFLSSFEFTTVHRSGKLQLNADPLSRRPGLEGTEDIEILDDEHLHDVADIYQVANVQPQKVLKRVRPISAKMLAQATQDDPVLKQIYDFVQKKTKPDKEQRKLLTFEGIQYVNLFECLSIKDGILFFKMPEVNGEPTKRRICLPSSLQSTAFDLVHAHEMGGHYGQHSTYLKLRQLFYWPGMYTMCIARVTHCVPCVTKRSSKPKGTHTPYKERYSYFNQKVYIDTCGPMTGVNFEGKLCRHFVSIQDGFTRYLVCVPVDKIDAQTVAEAVVNHWIMTFGCVEVIHSDNGSAFQSALFKEIMGRLGILQTFCPVYTPEANIVERAHKTIGQILRSDRRFAAKEWPHKLRAAVMAYNVTAHCATGISPFEAVFGRRATLPVDLIFPLPRKEGISWSKYMENLKANFRDMAKKVCNNQTLHLERPNHQARSPPAFSKGDCVYYFLGRVKPGLSKKLTCRWLGPFQVTKVVSESLVTIYPLGSWAERPKEIATIVNRLRKVDPKFSMGDLHPSSRKRIDLPLILDDLDELNEALSYQGQFDDEHEDEPAGHHPRRIIEGFEPMDQMPIQLEPSSQPPALPAPEIEDPKAEPEPAADSDLDISDPEWVHPDAQTDSPDEFEDAVAEQDGTPPQLDEPSPAVSRHTGDSASPSSAQAAGASESASGSPADRGRGRKQGQFGRSQVQGALRQLSRRDSRERARDKIFEQISGYRKKRPK